MNDSGLVSEDVAGTFLTLDSNIGFIGMENVCSFEDNSEWLILP
jgi:hypothetical protein